MVYIEPGGAKGASSTSRPRRAVAGGRVDYRDETRCQLLHRRPVTEEEAAMVRANLVQANRNRVAAGQPERPEGEEALRVLVQPPRPGSSPPVG